MNRGYSTIQLILTGAASIAAVYSFVYVSLFQPISMNQYTDHGVIQSLTASISDIKDNVGVIRTEVDALASQRGVRVYQQVGTTSLSQN